MKKCKNFLLLLSFFAAVVHLPVYSADFQEVDLQRLIRNHPLMKDFQPESGRFKNTPSEILSVEDLTVKKNQLSAKISELGKEKQIKLGKHLSSENTGEDNLWERIKEIDSDIEQHEKEIRELVELIEAKGVPGFETVLKISEKICNDIFPEITSNSAITLNKMPFQPPVIPPSIGNHDLRHFFYSPSSDALHAYIKHSIETGFLFKNVNKTVIYPQKK